MAEDEPKSAWEIALEKMNSRGGFEVEALTEEQKAGIADVRKRFRAKQAEVDIRQQDQRKKAFAQKIAPEALEKLEADFARERERLRADEESEIRKVREKKG
jgi:hypothetical protein